MGTWRTEASNGPMPLLDKRTASVLLTILVFVAAGAFIYAASRVLIVFLLSIFFAYLLEPLVSRFQQWTSISRGSRGLAILEVYVILCAAIALVFILLGLRITDQARNLSGALPGLFQKLSSGQIAQEIGSQRGWSYSTQIRLQQFLANHGDYILRLVGSVGARAASFVQNVIWIVFIPILAVFFLKDGRNFTEGLLNMVERAPQKRLLAGITDDLLLGYGVPTEWLDEVRRANEDTLCGDDYDGRLTTIRMAGQVGRLGCFNQGCPAIAGGTLIVGQAHHRPPGQAVHEVMQRGLHPGGCGGPFRV